MATTHKKDSKPLPAGKHKGSARKDTNARGAKTTSKATEPLEPTHAAPLIGARARNDLAGVAIAILALVLFALVLLPTDAVVAGFVSFGLHQVFGFGAVILPFLLLGWAATFFIKQRLTNSPVRLAIGLGVIYLAVIAFPGAFAASAPTSNQLLFAGGAVAQHGGFVGSALGWALVAPLGLAPAIIILIGLVIIGLVLIGLSVTRLFDWCINLVRGRKERKQAEYDATIKAGEANQAPATGSAYQLGPNEPGAANQAGAGGMAAMPGSNPQLQDTLFYPGGGLHEGNPLDTQLGATRRRRFEEEGFDPSFSAAQTAVFAPEVSGAGGADWAGAPGEAEAEQANPGAAEPTGTAQERATKKPRKQSSSKGVAAGSNASPVYTLPSSKLLRISREKSNTKAGAGELRSTANRLQATLEEFKVDGSVVGWIAGPTVTLYKISLGEGVRLNRITALQNDIQLSLAAQAVRIVAPIPGTSLVGIEVPNQARNEVLLGDVLDSARDAILALAIGKDVEGESIVADLGSMPHLLIGGTTGSGKSVAINSIIMSLLMRTTPEEVRLIMIDPKRVELTLYNGIPHLYVPVVTDAGQAASALAWCVAEMDRRLKLFEKHAVKNIKQFNTRVEANLEALAAQAEPAQAGTERMSGTDSSSVPADSPELAQTGTERMSGTDSSSVPADYDLTVEQENLRATLPYLVIVIDELADLMMLNGKEVESAISRLAQLARAAGLHLVVATQRPSTNVITGLIKANIVNRIAFTVASSIDSRVILDTPGAEDLIGLGDMLFSRPEYSKPVRIQGCLVSEPEIETVVEYWRGQGEVDYHEDILLASPGGGSGAGGGSFGEDLLDDDPLLWEAAEIVVSSQLGSTSTLQRRLKVGYARAGRIMDMLEMKGVVGPPNGSKPREVLLDDVLDIETLRAFG